MIDYLVISGMIANFALAIWLIGVLAFGLGKFIDRLKGNRK